MRRWWQDLTDLVLPTDCAGCGAVRTTLCPRCRTALAGGAPRRVRPLPEPSGLPVVYASAPYAEAVRALLLAHKERGALALTGALGAALAGAVRAGLGGPADAFGTVVLVPVPSARWAVRARGHDPVRRMALAAAGELRRTGTPARVAAVLRQRRSVADQAGLDARRRLENLAGALKVVAGGERLLAGGAVVLVDDLVTTGATLAEAARALREGTVFARERGNRGSRPVYENATREGREERRAGTRPEKGKRVHGAVKNAVVNALGAPSYAAVIAAPRATFEIAGN
ncbi:ComF family protein [Streptomyces misionensis]|uniref:ComF family protein n=1 Tax=Streptomyces misionensis TaxID=67331 RepID=A0A5C6JML3_9ACTN|nr:ComF family protein [Streptomyces misionensis]TWV42583.1 ComF family protein [Streptomyces misionensis]